MRGGAWAQGLHLVMLGGGRAHRNGLHMRVASCQQTYVCVVLWTECFEQQTPVVHVTSMTGSACRANSQMVAACNTGPCPGVGGSGHASQRAGSERDDKELDRCRGDRRSLKWPRSGSQYLLKMVPGAAAVNKSRKLAASTLQQ